MVAATHLSQSPVTVAPPLPTPRQSPAAISATKAAPVRNRRCSITEMVQANDVFVQNFHVYQEKMSAFRRFKVMARWVANTLLIQASTHVLLDSHFVLPLADSFDSGFCFYAFVPFHASIMHCSSILWISWCVNCLFFLPMTILVNWVQRKKVPTSSIIWTRN